MQKKIDCTSVSFKRDTSEYASCLKHNHGYDMNNFKDIKVAVA